MVTYYESGNLVRLGRYADAMVASDITALRNVGGVEFTVHLPPAGSMANALTIHFNCVSVAEGWPGGKHRARCPRSSP